MIDDYLKKNRRKWFIRNGSKFKVDIEKYESDIKYYNEHGKPPKKKRNQIEILSDDEIENFEPIKPTKLGSDEELEIIY